MPKRAALAVLLTVGVPLAAAAQSHTPEDEAACTPDVIRLCQQYIPKRQDIINCLTERKSELGPACFAVFSRPPSPAKAEEPKRGRRKPAAAQTGGNLY
jgi:hypothetical protein